MHTVLIANASPSGFVPQVRTKVPFLLVNLRIFLATELPLRDINPNPFLQFNQLLHHVLSLSVSPLWCRLKGDVPFSRSLVGLKETSPHVRDCNSLCPVTLSLVVLPPQRGRAFLREGQASSFAELGGDPRWGVVWGQQSVVP